MNVGLECLACRGDIKPSRKKPQRLREYSLRLYECLKCKKKMAVASFVVGKEKARWLERMYEEHTEDPGL